MRVVQGKKGQARTVTFPKRLARNLVAFWTGLRLFQVRPKYPFTGNQASRLSLLALHESSEAVQGPDKLTHRNPHIQSADPCSETSKNRKDSSNAPTNSCQCFCVMDAPEIYQPPGLVVVSEFLTAIHASDVGCSARNTSAFAWRRWD